MDNEEALMVAIASMAETIKRKNDELYELRDRYKALTYEMAKLKTQLAQATPLNNTGEPSPISPHLEVYGTT